MEESLLIEKHPTLYHMAEPGSWPSIQEHGLRSTEALLDLVSASSEEKLLILGTHRQNQVTHRGVLIRDQKPMNVKKLTKCLPDNITPQQWLQFLNRRVFFWTTAERLQTFRSAYGENRQLILEVPTSRMVEANRYNVWLCHINSGATRMPNHLRSFSTFTSIADFSYSSKRTPAEFTVMYSVEDIRRLASTVYEDGGRQGRVILYTNQDGSR